MNRRDEDTDFEPSYDAEHATCAFCGDVYTSRTGFEHYPYCSSLCMARDERNQTENLVNLDFEAGEMH
jgi:hypothetical protein